VAVSTLGVMTFYADSGELMSSSKGSGGENLVGCLYFIGIVFALALWQVTLVLIAIGGIYFVFNYTRKNARKLAAQSWIKAYRFSPCCFNGVYGVIDNIESLDNSLRLTYKPIHIDHGSNLTVYSFESSWVEDSVQKSVNQLFQQNNGFLLRGISVEASAIQTAFNCVGKISWCTQSLRTLYDMLEQVDKSIAISSGNPLLESSIDGMIKAKSDLESQVLRINDVKKHCSEVYENISEFLSVPPSLRSSDGIGSIDENLINSYNEIKSSFDYLVSFNKEYLLLATKK